MSTESPGLRWEVTTENWQRAAAASSAACVHADAIKEKYPEYAHVKVNVATIQVSDRERGVRYVYLTPSSVAQLLLFFDQGWSVEGMLPKQFRIKQPVKIIPIVRSVSGIKATEEHRAARVAELEAKEQSQEPLTSHEKSVLKRMKNPKKAPSRPTTYGPSKGEVVGNDVVRIGAPGAQAGIKNDNLIHERNRHFGSKTAQPSQVFKQAVAEAVAEDRATRGE